jgi:ABC-type cobalamin/Fe3+-siderophores transport system ATPase subunit
MDIKHTRNRSKFILQNINIEFQVGKINIITGPTSSGKTSLLLALLGGEY